MKKLILPNSITDETSSRANSNELVIQLSGNDQDNWVIVNGNKSNLESMDLLIASNLQTMKKNQLFPTKAILRIDQFTKMSVVNQIKEILQKEEILNLEYLHRKK